MQIILESYQLELGLSGPVPGAEEGMATLVFREGPIQIPIAMPRFAAYQLGEKLMRMCGESVPEALKAPESDIIIPGRPRIVE